MKHIDIALILQPWICTLADQVFDQEKVSEERREMKGREAVIASARNIDPFFKISFVRLVLLILHCRVILKVAAVAIGQDVITQYLD